MGEHIMRQSMRNRCKSGSICALYVLRLSLITDRNTIDRYEIRIFFTSMHRLYYLNSYIAWIHRNQSKQISAAKTTDRNVQNSLQFFVLFITQNVVLPALDVRISLGMVTGHSINICQYALVK